MALGLLMLWTFALPAAAQSGSRFVLPYQTVIDATGVPLPGALLNFYISGTNTRLNTYSDSGLTTPNPNPVVADSAGMFPNIFLSGTYKVVLTDSSGNQIWTADPVIGSATSITAPLIINPPAGTTTQAIIENVTLPSVGTQSLSYSPNVFTVVNPGYASNGSSLDAFGLLAADAGLRINYTAAGASGGSSSQIHTGLLAAAAESSGAGRAYQVAGFSGTVYSNIVSGSTAGTGDTIWGNIGYGNVGPSGALYEVIPLECEVAVATLGSVAVRTCLSLTSLGQGQGSSVDTAILASVSGAPSSDYGTAAAFKNLITIDVGSSNSGVGSIAALTSSGNIIAADGNGTFTAGCVVCLPNATFTTLFSFANFAMNAAGHTVIGAGASAIPSSPTWLKITPASSGTLLLNADTNNTGGVDGITAEDVSTNNNLFAGVAEAANTQTHFGQTVGNFAEVVSLGTSNVGMLLGTTTNEPLIIGTNNAARLTITGAGAATFSSTLNVVSGYSVNGSAGLTQTCTVNQAKTLIFTLGILTGGTCNT